MSEQQFHARDIIFREGEVSDCAYVIVRGKVEILKHGSHGEVQLAVLEPGATFGEMGLFEPRSPRSATARAVEDTHVDVISQQEFIDMVHQSPPRMMPIMETMVERLRATNSRVSSAEQATVILESEIDKVVLRPGSEAVEKSFKGIELPVGRLPVRIGGYSVNDPTPAPAHGQFYIASDGPPLAISRQHFEIIIEEGGIFLVDLGSRFGTIVNGRHIGRGRGSYKQPLQKGDNEVRLGNVRSPYILIVSCL